MKVWIVCVKDFGECVEAKAFVSRKAAEKFADEVWKREFPEDVKIFESVLEGGD